jgi:hypothetical protein
MRSSQKAEDQRLPRLIVESLFLRVEVHWLSFKINCPYFLKIAFGFHQIKRNPLLFGLCFGWSLLTACDVVFKGKLIFTIFAVLIFIKQFTLPGVMGGL